MRRLSRKRPSVAAQMTTGSRSHRHHWWSLLPASPTRRSWRTTPPRRKKGRIVAETPSERSRAKLAPPGAKKLSGPPPAVQLPLPLIGVPLLVNALRSGRIWPAHMEQCQESWTLGHTFLDKPLPIRLLSLKACQVPQVAQRACRGSDPLRTRPRQPCAHALGGEQEHHRITRKRGTYQRYRRSLGPHPDLCGRSSRRRREDERRSFFRALMLYLPKRATFVRWSIAEQKGASLCRGHLNTRSARREP